MKGGRIEGPTWEEEKELGVKEWSKHFKENYVDEDAMLIELLGSGCLFLLEVESKHGDFAMTPAVNCNDTFYWACADAEFFTGNEGMKYRNELYDLYMDWKENNTWGPTKWACLKRGMRPQKPVMDAMKNAGYWPEELENLPKREE